MFSSCWEALDCSWRSLRTSICQSQLHEMLHTPRSPIFIQRFSAPQLLVQSSSSPWTKCLPPATFAWSPSFLGLHTYKWRNAGVGSICPRTRSATKREWHEFASLEEEISVAWTTTNTCTLASPLRSCDSGCPRKARTHFLNASAPHCSRGLVQRIDIGDTSAKSKPELAALQGFILLMSQLCQLELVIKEELQKLYHKCWRDWERHIWCKQELQSCDRTSLTFAVWEKTWCGLLQHSLILPQPRRQCSGTANADSPRVKTEAFLKYQMKLLSSGKIDSFVSIYILSDLDQLLIPQPGSMGKSSTQVWGSPQYPQLQQLTWNHTREEEILPNTGPVPKLFCGLRPHLQELPAPGSFFMGYRFHCNGRTPCLMSRATENSVRVFIKGTIDTSSINTIHSTSSPTTYSCVCAGNASSTDTWFLNFLTSHSLQH